MIKVGIIGTGLVLGFLANPIFTIISIVIAIIRLIKIALD